MQTRSTISHCRSNFASLTRIFKSLHTGTSAFEQRSPLMDSSDRYCYNPTLYWNPQVEEYFIKAYGSDHFSRICKALTRPSCYSCLRVNFLKTTPDAVSEKLLQMQSYTGETGMVTTSSISTSCVDGVTEKSISNSQPTKESDNDNFSNELKGFISSDLIHKCPIPGLDYVLFVQGSGPHELTYAPAPGRPLKEVIVSRKCAEAVLRGAQVYVPGVLACSAHVEKGDTVAVSVAIEQPQSDGKWGTGITRGTVLQGLETDPHYFQRKGLYIGQGTAMLSRAGIFRDLKGLAVCMNERVFDLPSFNNVLLGELFLQNLPSIVVAHAVDPQKGERILDMCAAPGGKTTAIAMLMRDEGEVVAADRSHNKVMDIQNLAAEMGLKSIVTYKLDALKSVARESEPDMNKLNGGIDGSSSDLSSITKEGLEGNKLNEGSHVEGNGNAQVFRNVGDDTPCERRKNGLGKGHLIGVRVQKSKGFLPNSFDRVLLDAPCSALGLRPRLFAGEETIESLRKHVKYQRKMFDQAVQLVRPGGVLVYSTCTINPGENEALVRYALDKYKFLSLAAQHPRVGGPGLVGSFEFSDGYVEEWLRPGEEELVQRFDPSSSDTIGFFIAKFKVGCRDP